MKLKVNVTQSKFFISLAILFILGGSFAVFAFGGTNPPEFGHSGTEIEVDIGSGPQDLNTVLNTAIPATLNCEIIKECWTDGSTVPGCNPNGQYSGEVVCDGGYEMMGGACINEFTGERAHYDAGDPFGTQKWFCQANDDGAGNKYYTVYGVCCQ
jgi:hypothetical protein